MKGQLVASAPSPRADSIPWLLVVAVGHSGTGVMNKVTSIQRLHTLGGKAPATGRDAAHTGEKTPVHYAADYEFYGPRSNSN